MKTSGKNNGVFTYTLKDGWEMMIHELIYLSIKSSGFGLESDYMVVRDYCKKYELDVIETFSLIKNIVSKLGK